MKLFQLFFQPHDIVPIVKILQYIYIFSTDLNKILFYSQITIFFINNTLNNTGNRYLFRYSKLSTAFLLHLQKKNRVENRRFHPTVTL